MKEIISITIFILFCTLISGCGVENTSNTDVNTNNEEYTKEVYLIETANDIREIRSLHDNLIEQLAEETEPSNVSITLMDISIDSTDQSYRLVGNDSFEFKKVKSDLKEIQSYVDEQYIIFSNQKELDRTLLSSTIDHLETLLDKLESDFDSLK